MRASLATSTGPSPPGGWSNRNRQYAHVDETVRYSFILVNPFLDRPVDPYGVADYCLVSIGDERVLCEPDLGGRFRFQHRLAHATAGDKIKVSADAYKQNGRRDFIHFGGDWRRGDSPYDEPDVHVVTDSLTLKIYQAKVELQIDSGSASLDVDSGKLEFVKHDGTATSSPVFIDRPHRRGFIISGPDESGTYSIVYEPSGGELNPSGNTEIRFTVHDYAGHAHSAKVTIPTP